MLELTPNQLMSVISKEKSTKLAKKYPELFYQWKNMMRKCYDPTHSKYPEEGARGIRVCKEWASFNTFGQWALSNGWKNGVK